MKIRKWILKIHLYGGLLCFWYLIIFAVSSLQFQHHFEFMKPKLQQEEIQEKKLSIPETENLSDFAKSIQNELHLAGWDLPWKTYRDSSGIFYTEIQNPKAQYKITFDALSSTAKIIKKEKGFWIIMNSLHGFSGKMPNAPLLFFWKIFTYICLIVVTFSIFSGIWLWANRSTDKLFGLLTVSGIVVLSLLLMTYIYLNG
jgi:hypothetical protein